MTDIRQGEEGFTLIELLVSLAILTVALALLLQAISGALDRTRESRDEEVATSLVQSLLAREGNERPLSPGETGGLYSNGFRWSVTVRRYGTGDDRKAWNVEPYVVRATVLWNEGASPRTRSLSALRIVAPQKAS